MKYKYRVDSYSAFCEEDTYSEGIIMSCGSDWSNKELPVEGEFDSICEALESVCEVNSFSFDKNDWEYSYDDASTFYTDVEVNSENCEASEDELEEWKEGRLRLWCCHLSVYISKFIPVDIDKDEWTKELSKDKTE